MRRGRAPSPPGTGRSPDEALVPARGVSALWMQDRKRRLRRGAGSGRLRLAVVGHQPCLRGVLCHLHRHGRLQHREWPLRARPVWPRLRAGPPLRSPLPRPHLRRGRATRRSGDAAATPRPHSRFHPPVTRVLVAPLEFKGSLTAGEAARAMEAGVRRGWPEAEVRRLPLADGGPGTADALVEALHGEWHSASVHDALGRPLQAQWASWRGGGVVEMARASGLSLLAPSERDALVTTTYGT